MLADRIDEALKMNGMSQSDLARKSGLSTSQISQVRSRKIKNPSFGIVVRIADALEVSLDWLAGKPDRFDELTPRQRMEVERYAAYIGDTCSQNVLPN